MMAGYLACVYQQQGVFVGYLKKIAAIVCCLVLVACTSVGSKMIPQNRESFNSHLLESDEEQLLMNIVRLQYGDRPYFLNADSLTSSVSVSSSISPSFSLSDSLSGSIADGVRTWNSQSLSRSYSIAPSFSFSDSPTVIYTPLQGERFTRLMLTPISLQNIYLLLQSGWSTARVLRVTTQGIGNLSNAVSASRPSTTHVPEYKDFITFVHALRALQLEGKMAIEGTKIDNQFVIQLVFTPDYKTNPAIQAVLKVIHVQPDSRGVIIVSDKIIVPSNSSVSPAVLSGNEVVFVNHDNAVAAPAPVGVAAAPVNNVLFINTRSLLAVLYYLAKSVEISPEDIQSGIVQVPKNKDGTPFDWNQVTRGMLKIHSSKFSPSDANVSVYYRHHWYYIADNDSNSKETFSMLMIIFALQTGDSSGPVPMITLPVR